MKASYAISSAQAIDGKGAFRRFKDVLMTYGTERERWFAFRSERLRVFMEAWLSAHGLAPVARQVWPADAPAARARHRGGRCSVRAARAARKRCASSCANWRTRSALAIWRK